MTTDTFVSERRLASANRRRRDLGKISDSILGEYYFDRDGWVRYAEGSETEQGRRLMDIKGWRPIPRSPRVEIIEEHGQKWHAILRREDGPALFPVAQIVSHGWHKNAPVIFVCRQQLDNYDHPAHTAECWSRPVFPQLEGVAIYTARCAQCSRTLDSIESQAHVESLIKKHMEVAHREHLVNRELVTGLRDALAPSMGNTAGGMTPEAVAQIAAAAAMAVMSQLGLTPNTEPTGNIGKQ